jgi:hypothetical protein
VKSPVGPKKMTAAIIGAGTTTLDTITERKMENVTEGLQSRYLSLLQSMLTANRDNDLTICDPKVRDQSIRSLSNRRHRPALQIFSILQ